MENKNINRIYDLWLEKATADPDLKEELLSIKGKDEEILDRFYRSLEFGTAGLRGVIGAGTNRMNYYTVERRLSTRFWMIPKLHRNIPPLRSTRDLTVPPPLRARL